VATLPAGPPAGGSGSSAPSGSRTPGAAADEKPTPLLDRLGRDLTRLAKEGSLAPLVGREEEMGWLIETLVRTTKRNPVLLGAAGAGKTAIVEGLAQRIVAGRVPEPLRHVRLVEVPLSALVAGTEYRGQLEQRLVQLVEEASQSGIVLFFDEIHLLEGAGQSEGGLGIDEILKPALARGRLAVIGATTPEAYRATIERDSALARRFTTIAITELDRAASRPIVRAVRDRLATSRGVRVSDAAIDVLLEFAETAIINRRFPDKAIDLLEQAVAAAVVAGRTRVDRADAVRTTERWAERASSTPTLERFGRDLVTLARAGKLGPIVGREREIDALVQVLLRRTRRNPLLVGPAGSGKTAVVEGLAIRIGAGDVPPALVDVRLFDLALLPLAQAIESEPSTLLDLFVEARHPSVVIFFDEIHQLAFRGIRDLGEALKPALARGEIACIGATTGDEFQAHLESEAALVRRFSLIPVEPMDMAAVRVVLEAVRDSLARARGVRVDDAAIDELVALADQFFPNRHFPDKGVDLIEQAIAFALSHGRQVVDETTARDAVADLVGMPLDPTASLARLAPELRDRALLAPDELDVLLAKLGVTLRGLDSGDRPDALMLIWGSASGRADTLAEVLARCVFGRASAVVDVDLSGMTEDASISSLLGSAPGLVGSERPLPLHGLRRTPWQVVILRGIDRCARSIRETIVGALEHGVLTDAMGRPIPLASTIVLLTAPSLVVDDAADAANARAGLTFALGPGLVSLCDVVSGGRPIVATDDRSAWIRRELLGPLAARFARQGLDVKFEASFVEWLSTNLPADDPLRFIDEDVTTTLVASMPADTRSLSATVVDGRARLVAREIPRR
jgi:ATP-dependent Clp protease ATP-binding subunit ClpC